MTQGAVARKSTKELLVGTWDLISQEQVLADGSKRLDFGPDSKGVNIYTADGRFFVLFVHGDLPKIATRDRTKATAEEATAIVAGSIGYFGSYTIDEASKMIVYRVEGTTFVNMLGVEQRRLIVVLTADELRYRNIVASTGGQIEVTLQRAK
jgi:Lipocalin-like domain